MDAFDLLLVDNQAAIVIEEEVLSDVLGYPTPRHLLNQFSLVNVLPLHIWQVMSRFDKDAILNESLVLFS